MDFSEFARSGTAPPSKPKSSHILNSDRPKTRASIIESTGAYNHGSDLAIPRGSSATNKKPSALSNNEYDYNYNQDTGPELETRVPKSKEGANVKPSYQQPSGLLSAYTQNMPKFILNAANPKKSQRTSSGTAAGRVAKESRNNTSQINELRAAYGADIPIGRSAPNSSSGNRAKSAKASAIASVYDDPSHRPVTAATAVTSKASRTQAFETNDQVSAKDNNPSLNYNEEDWDSYYVRPIGKVSGGGGIKFSSQFAELVNHETSSRGHSATASYHTGNEQDAPYEKDNNNNNYNKVGTNYRAIAEEEEKQSSRKKKASSSGLLQSMLRAKDQTGKMISRDSPTADLAARMDVMSPFEDELLELNGNLERTSLMSSPQTKANNLYSSSLLREKAASSPSFERNAALPIDRCHSTEQFQLAEGTPPKPPKIRNKAKSPVLLETGCVSSNNAGNSPMIAVQKAVSEDSSTPMFYIDNSDGEEDSCDKVLKVVDDEDLKGSSDSSGVVLNRPQSRKLYLGSDVSTEQRTPNSNNSSSSKTPKSAGARYGSSSSTLPVENAHVMKRLNSFDDARFQTWKDTEESLKERPPSRQSSAFPVHLADDIKKPSSTPATIVATAGTVAGTGNISSLSSSSRSAVKVMASSAKAQLDLEKESPATLLAESSIQVDTSAITSTNTYNTRVKDESGTPAPTTELRSIKKNRSSGTGGGSVASASGTAVSLTGYGSGDEDSSVYSKRPPSRQKLAAQHLFDDVVDKDRSSVSSRGGTASISTGRDGMSSHGVSAGGGSRGLSNRSSLYYDPKEDGFGDLDPQDSVPFAVKVNYGGSTNDDSKYKSSDYRKGGVSGRYDDKPAVNASTGASKSDFTSPINSHNGRSSHSQQVKEQQVQLLTLVKPAPPPLSEVQAPNRPKSVHSLVPTKPVGSQGPGRINKIRGAVNNYDYLECEELESETFRSKTANSYLSSSRDKAAIPSSSSGTGVSSPTGRVSTGMQAFGGWTDSEDPRCIPRAQNKFGLEADSGWTSPSLLGRNDDVMLATAERDDLYSSHDLDDQGDDITIMTEESGNFDLNNSMSMQSFQLESSLGEDFLSLFAPAFPS